MLMKGQTYVILAIVLTIIIAVFAVINVEPVVVNYLFWSAESPLILVILFSVLMGGITTAIAGMVKIFRMQKETVHLQSENKKLKNELEKSGVSTAKLLKEKTEEKKTNTRTE